MGSELDLDVCAERSSRVLHAIEMERFEKRIKNRPYVWEKVPDDEKKDRAHHDDRGTVARPVKTRSRKRRLKKSAFGSLVLGCPDNIELD
jgi:hypothetical protein